MSEFKFSKDDSLWNEEYIKHKRISAGKIMLKSDRNIFCFFLRPLTRIWDKLLLELASAFFVSSLTLYYSLILRRKMSHNNGVTLSGEIEIVKDQNFPPHSFFVPGKKFECRIRHAAAGFMDDAMLCVRSVSIKFSNERVKSPLDLEFNTGRSLFWSVRNFFQFAMWKKEFRGMAYQKFWLKFPAGQQAGQDSVCNNPSSYASLAYYSQTPTLFIGDDGKKRYAKYRVIPADGQAESQKNSVDEIGYFWGDQRVEPDTPLHRNYLKEEMKNRIEKYGEVHYKLQIQLADEEVANYNPAIFNSNIHWDENLHPWHDLANFFTNKVLSHTENVMTYYGFSNCPKSLHVIPATSIDDYNSLNHLRMRAGIAKKVRIWSTNVFGMPKALPDMGPRNIDELTCEKLGSIKGFENDE